MRRSISDGRLWIGTAVLTVVALVFLLPPADGGSELKYSGALQALDRWAAQRAYPGTIIPAGAFGRAWEQSKLVSRLERATDDGRGVDAWTVLGPYNIGGRTLGLAVDPANPDRMFAGSAGGGLWKTTVGGVGADAWDRVETGYPNLAVSTVVMDPADSDVLYIGTGEAYRYQTSDGGEVYRLTRGSYGIGILKSTDGGDSWTRSLDWTYDQNRGVWMIAIHPTDPSVVYAATTEGIYKSTDAGGDWTLVHDVIMGTDVRIHPTDHDILFTAHGNFSSEGQGIYRSTDAGASWNKLTSGLPTAWSGKAQLAVSSVQPTYVYASIGNAESGRGLYRSTDTGDTWEQAWGNGYQSYQGFYSHYVLPSPFDANLVFVAGIDIYRSTNGGSSFQQRSDWTSMYYGTPPPEGPIGGPDYAHADHHFAVWHPTDPNTIFFCSDGGVFKSTNGGDSFESLIGGLVTSQFYKGIGLSTTTRDKLIGGMQDTATAVYRGGPAWERHIGGDGSWAAIHPEDDEILYGSAQYLYLMRSSNDGAYWNYIAPPESGGEDSAFIAPFVLSPAQPDVVYAGRERIYRSTNGGFNWSSVHGGNPLNDNHPATCMAASATDENVVYVATTPNTDRARVFRTTDGTTFVEITGSLPDRFISDLAVDPTNHDVVYAAIMGFGTSHLFRSTNGGDSWSDIGQGLPDIPCSAVIVDPLYPEVVYAGGDLGVYVSPDSGQSWYGFQDGMGAVMVNDLRVFAPDRLLRAATHGNGIWERPLYEPGGDLSAPRVIAGPGPAEASPPQVRVFPPQSGAAHVYQFDAYGATGYGVNVAAGDLDGDDLDELLTGAGPGAIYGPHVRGFAVDGTPLPGLSFLAYGTNKFGVNAAAGDLDNDGYDEIVTGAGPGAVFGPHVRGWNWDGSGAPAAIPGISFFAYGTPKYGVNVACGDIDGDGYDELLTGAGPGTVYGPHVRGWNVDGGAAAAISSVSFLAYGTNQWGVRVSCGDVDGDGIDEIVTGAGPGVVFGAHVRGWNVDGGAVTPLPGLSFFAYEYPEHRYGVAVSARADLDGDGRADIVTGLGPDPDAGTTVRVFTYDGGEISPLASLESFTGLTHGATVAAGRF